MANIVQQYTGADQRFRWLNFVTSLEKASKKYVQAPVAASTLSRSPSTLKLLQETQAKLASGSEMNLPPLLRVGSKSRLAKLHTCVARPAPTLPLLHIRAHHVSVSTCPSPHRRQNAR